VNKSRETVSLFFCPDELADLAMHSESDSVRDEYSSSGIRSEGEDEPRRSGSGHRGGDERTGGIGGGGPLSSVSWEQRGSTSTLSSCSTTSQARLVQSSAAAAAAATLVRENSGAPPPPPPRTSSALGAGNGGSGGGTTTTEPRSQQQPPSSSSDLGKKATCMQCYLSGHSDGSIESMEQPSSTTEDASSCGGGGGDGGTPRDRDSGLGPESELPALVRSGGESFSPPPQPASKPTGLEAANDS
jgi:hypothetical protein